MGFGTGIWLVILGVLGAANLIIAKKPEAKDLIDKISPYQGWMGAISCLWGLWITLWMIIGIGGLALYPIWWFSMVAAAVVQVLLGFVLGIGVMKTFIKDPTAQEKMDTTLAKIAPYSGTLGLIAIGLGIWTVLANILFL